MTAARGDLAPDVGGLGRKIEKPKPQQPEWVPTATKGIERNVKTGQMRTAIPPPAAASYRHPLIPVGEATEINPLALPATTGDCS